MFDYGAGGAVARWLPEPWLAWLRTDIAKLCHFGHDETGLLRGQ